MPIRAASKIGLDILLIYCLIEGCVGLLNSFLPSCFNIIAIESRYLSRFLQAQFVYYAFSILMSLFCQTDRDFLHYSTLLSI